MFNCYKIKFYAVSDIPTRDETGELIIFGVSDIPARDEMGEDVVVILVLALFMILVRASLGCSGIISALNQYL